MKSQSSIIANVGHHNGRMTLARSAALSLFGYMAPLKATTEQIKKRWQAIVSKVAPSVFVNQDKASSKPKLATETTKAEAEREEVLTGLDTNVLLWFNSIRECGIDDQSFSHQSSRKPSWTQSSHKKGKDLLSGKSMTSCDPDYIDIDSDHTDPQLCSLYAADMHKVFRVAELNRRPYPKFMETRQHDITNSMRGILVDWLVEVSEDCKLEPDTLYLTVYLIDWFLSQNYIERQRLQLLGITCMLIASKYEEICAPQVEKFCFMTDNTCSRDEVLKMESQVIKFCGFQLFAPTAKTFLRRFLRVGQASHKSPSLELEYLANFFTELTLVDYGFLNFLPSVIAASSVFLARWMLDQSSDPWNATLEHYTYYRASDLKVRVFALRDLQLNTSGCPLNAIRMKYRQEKFKSVAALSSPKLLDTLF